ncbi:MAG: Potassium-transporting ATPase C chain [Syntrophorhabdus sp. PtaU1.Bin002]|nr:MAG: Potassium-transporting ATPase C chain [Syntrophorhabdus sp. PtaU1.Bin002]
MKNLFTELRVALIAIIVLALLVCGIYPAMVWVVAQGLFPTEAKGSLIMRGGKITGSDLIGQGFIDSKYFHPRPSAAGSGYDAASSGGTNLGPTSKRLVDTIKQRVFAYRSENGLAPDILVPADAVTASASGLDPHISLKNAYLQAPRVAKARELSEKTVLREVAIATEGRDLGILGEARVNVLKLNIALDGILR